MSDTHIVYKGRNAPFKAKITDFDGANYTDARMAAISRMELRYRPTEGATVEPIDSNIIGHAGCFDWATYAADADVVIAIGLLTLTVGHDQAAELVVYDPTYPQGRVVDTLGIKIDDEAQGTGPLIDVLYAPLTIEDDYPLLLSDFSRPVIRINSDTIKTITWPVMTAAMDGRDIVFEIMGSGDVDLVREPTTTMTFAGVTHSKLTGTVQYSMVRLRYNHTLNAMIPQDGTGSWKGGSI